MIFVQQFQLVKVSNGETGRCNGFCVIFARRDYLRIGRLPRGERKEVPKVPKIFKVPKVCSHLAALSFLTEFDKIKSVHQFLSGLLSKINNFGASFPVQPY